MGRGDRIRTCVHRVRAGCLRPLDYTPSVGNRWYGRRCRTLACRLKAGCSAPELHPHGAASARSGPGSSRQRQPLRRQQRLKGLLLPQGQGSLRPSFSASSLLPWTTRSPRLTCVSDGKPRRRLLVTSKARRFVVDGLHVVLLVVDWIRPSPGSPGWARSTGLRLMRASLYR